MTTQRDEPWLPWCLRLFGELNAANERAIALAKTLTPQQLNSTPAPGVWSVGQCLEHLYVTKEVYLRPMSTSLGGRQPAVVQEITPGWLGRWFIRNYIEPSSKFKTGPCAEEDQARRTDRTVHSRSFHHQQR